MKIRVPFTLAAIALASACSSGEQENADVEAAAPTVHSLMTERIDPDADAIWAIGNAAIAADASLDAAKMTEANWTDLEQAARRMAEHARELAQLDPLLLKHPDAKIADEGVEGAPTPEAIQGHLDRDPELFRSLAEALAIHADELAAAAEARNAAVAGERINQLDGVCESCHLEFWYPEQKALMEEMGILPAG